ncbi:MarR family winged helix-turn-helix transcriptional regulator [Zavarzinia aquatilis]|uniref:MarR family transcriptional regulator n=1 Tax=Zavarzinia aquatilis TaxID=2211142 RepID=A0A317E621_9PROT|nr:MarR family transcriptional regulator [Zavarzinia aquatilis]PWR22558.1 MarR family transcriptional regulator [Zavarzinia aquatilis]
MTDQPKLSLRLDDQLCFALYSASHLMTKAYRPMLTALGLTYPQYLALLVLWEADDLTVGALGERLFLDSGTLTPLLKRMEAQGLVERRRDPADERQVRIRLTETGRALEAEARRHYEDMVCGLGASGDEVKALRDAVAAFRAQLANGS